jgi:hypothetical protein
MGAETLDAEIARLSSLSLIELRGMWSDRFGTSPQLWSAELTRLWLAWELQAERQGGLDGATRRHLRQLARSLTTKSTNDARSITPKPGTVLVREWGGATHKVVVLDGGFSWNGRTWASLSEIASQITGTRWSGPRFFGLHRRSET